jgi:predicted Zn-dependent peptidase
MASVDGRADTFNQYATLLGDPRLVNDALPNVLAVTAEQVREVVGDVMRPDNRVVLTFVPALTDDQEAAA